LVWHLILPTYVIEVNQQVPITLRQ